MTEMALVANALIKKFKKKEAVRQVSFEIPRGSICGLVGPNGAGKTTIIKMLLDICPPDSGWIKILGLDPRKNYVSLRQRIGYVPEKHNIYEWMKIRQVLDLTSAVYLNWDWKEFDRINGILNLPMDRKVRELSRGELAKLALIVALSHKPDLLILDEPTSGLDPLVRREFLEAIVALLENKDCTVFFSTHILSDVERVADRVIVISEGTIIADDTLDQLRRRFTRVSFIFDDPPSNGKYILGAKHIEKGLREWISVFDDKTESQIIEMTVSIGAKDFLIQPMTLEDVFIHLVEKKEENMA